MAGVHIPGTRLCPLEPGAEPVRSPDGGGLNQGFSGQHAIKRETFLSLAGPIDDLTLLGEQLSAKQFVK
jgi:hypothetical protein